MTTSFACLQTDFHYEWDGHVRGRVVTADGQPVSGLVMTLLLADDDDPREESGVRTGPGGEGGNSLSFGSSLTCNPTVTGSASMSAGHNQGNRSAKTLRR